MFADEDLVPISALAQYVYCPRRAALLFIERQWADNVFTIEGRHVHQKAHEVKSKERIPGGYVMRGLLLKSEKLGLIGAADVVEFYDQDPAGLRVVVVEYKRGKHKPGRQLEYQVQLCAQIICLEEMLGVHIPEGAIFFARSKHRFEVQCQEALRLLVEETTQKVRNLLRGEKTPMPEYGRKCRGCSLIEICLPKVIGRRKTQDYVRGILREHM